MAKHIFKGEGAPTFAPKQVGHHYIDTLNGVPYISIGTASSADWKAESVIIADINGISDSSIILNNGSAGTTPNYSNNGVDTITLNIPLASTSGVTAGLLSNTQYQDLNNRVLIKENVLYVSKNSGTLPPQHFNSIKDAIDSITTASDTNLFVIKVSPGIYVEDTITGKPYVTIIGDNNESVIIEVDSTSKHVIIGENAFGIKNVTLTGATDSNKYAIYFSPSSAGIGMTAENIFFGDNYGYAYLDNDIAELAVLTLNNSTSTALSAPTVGFACSSSLTAPTILVINTFIASFLSNLPDLFYAEGSGSILALSNITAQGIGGGSFIRIRDGARIVGKQLAQELFDVGLEVENVGAAPTLQITGIIFVSNTDDCLISHPGATGAIQGLADSTKVTVDPSSDITLSYLDAFTPGTGAVTLGDVFQGDRHDRILAISRLIRETSPIGAYTGGEISLNSGFDIDVDAGAGFLQDSVDDYMKEVTWSSDTLTIPSSSTHYIYVDGTGTVTSSSSEPNTLQNIILGRVDTTASGIHFIDKSSFRSNQLGTRIEQFQREAIGSIFATGCIVTENGTRGLDIGSGVYYFGNTRFTPSGGTAVSWGYHYRDGSGGYVDAGSQSTVNNSQYDDDSGSLVSLTTSYYAKHALYLSGDGTEEKRHLVISQAEYANLTLAEQGDIPTPPPEFSDGVVLIASIIVQQGTTNIVQIRDERPIIGFKASGVAASTFHGNLLGLNNDDHPQYLLVNGSRAMTGTLDMGTNALTNVTTVNGVTVETHASRHLPNGADPLTTAAPGANISATTSNSVGTANSLSRSDHGHAITTGAASAQVPDQSNATGSSASLARADHVHNIPTAAPSANLTASTTNAQGIVASFARSDHSHAITTAAASTQTPDQSNAIGSAAGLARADHVHNIPTAAAASISTSSSNTQGAASSFARSDHTHDVTITNTEVTATIDTTSTSATDVLIASMTSTPAAGTYLVMFSTSVESTNDGAELFISIYSGGSQVTHTERLAIPNVAGSNEFCLPVATQCITTVNGAQAIEARWRRTAGTITAHQRTLTIIRLT